jgi:AAA domain-containing protein
VTNAAKAEIRNVMVDDERRIVNPRPHTEAQRPYIINKGRTVNAIYITPDVPAWADNPLECALPRALDIIEAAARLAQEPKYDELVRKAPDHVRRLLLHDAMKRLFIPLDIHIDLQQRLQCAIRVGYSDRNPMETDYRSRLETKLDEFDQYAGQHNTEIDNSATTASGFHLLGLIGGGKSRTTLRCLQLLPQTIRHSIFQDRKFTYKQLVWLKLDCPFDGNPKGLCIQFFNTVDAILGTNYRRNYAGKRRIIDEMLSDMAFVTGNHSLGVLIVDEIQRLSLAKSQGADKLLNFFVQLVSTIGVPVVLVGTYKGMSVLSGEFSQIRRGTGQGDMIWDRMENDAQWRHFVESLWRYQYVRKDSSPDDRVKDGSKDSVKNVTTLSDVLYDETQGIVDFAIKLFMFAQERAIETGRERINAGLIHKAAKDKLKIPRLVLNALRMKDMKILEKFEDLYPSAMKDYLSHQTVEPQLSGKLASSPEINAILEDYRQENTNQPDALEEGGEDTKGPVTTNSSVTEDEAN